MDYKELSITNIPAISAIYFALLQCKYDFYPIERKALLIDKLRSFIISDCVEYDFFSDVKQNTCEVYPYWPRAAMLETATFYIDSLREQFTDFNAYKNSIMSAKNILDIERNQLFWDWIIKFPETLKLVLQSNSFSRYLKWENDWIAEQNQKYKRKLKKIEDIIARCKEKMNSPIQNIQIVLNPIKCVYSADYHLIDNNFIFCSGALSEESVIHEFFHQIVHPIVENRKDEILCCNVTNLDIDTSYYLNNDELGILNAFEEYMVRVLTDAIVSGDIPENLDVFLDQEISKRHKLN
ncbi:hypothetical protein [Hydrogeniiclostridium mannosilyticum]|uniref:hypothetical protein n=1 Tax=Hydrogeniiclostridium mannosilyticum TaxID=2764322 RepID=UPI0018AB1F2C|nr:hypothetical protein [Hydrogeniiclostridium mannosilyticum]